MKTIYGIIDHAWPTKVVLSDKVLSRIDSLICKLKDFTDRELEKFSFSESVWIAITYGRRNGTEPKAEGPVLQYGDECDCSKMKCVDTIVHIEVSPYDASISTFDEEGLEDFLGPYEHCTIKKIPNVFFSERFVRQAMRYRFPHWVEHMKDLVNDMPEEHRRKLGVEMMLKRQR